MRKHSLLAVTAVFALCTNADADVYKCVGTDGTTVYSDRACEAKPERPAAPTAASGSRPPGTSRDVPVVSAAGVLPASDFDRKMHDLLQLTQLSVRESGSASEISLALAARIDPSLSSFPPDSRRVAFGRYIETDLRADLPQLDGTFAAANQSLLKELESQVPETDADALLRFAHGPTGVSYLQFLADMRPIYASAARTVQSHADSGTPIAQAAGGEAALQTRLRLVAIATGATALFRAQDVANNSHDPTPYAADGLHPAQIVAVTGPGLDDIAARYEVVLREFEAFNASPSANRFFAAIGKPMATKMSVTETAMNGFSQAELAKYGARWKAVYRSGAFYVVARTQVIGGSAPQILRGTYSSSRGRALDVTRTLQNACSGGNCRVACGNQLAGDPDFGSVKFCRISFQCFGRPVQNVSLQEGRTLTLTCAP